MLVILSACNGCDDGLRYCTGDDLDTFPLNLVVLTADADAPTATSTHPSTVDPTLTLTGEEVLRGEVDILNQYFVDESGGAVCDGGDCVQFEYRSHHFRDDIADTSCALLDFGDMTERMYLDETDPSFVDLNDGIEAAVFDCADTRLVDPYAINLYVYDECTWDPSSASATCGSANSRGRSAEQGGVFHPYVALDLERLQHQTQSPEEHEMGHAFSLGHVCDPAVTSASDDSNIMQSTCAACGATTESGSGGARTLGFGTIDYDIDDCALDQVQTIVDRAREIQAGWCALALQGESGE